MAFPSTGTLDALLLLQRNQTAAKRQCAFITESWHPGERADFAELARQLLPRRAAIGRAIDLPADAAGIDQVRIGTVDREVPHRAVGAARHLHRLPGHAAVGRAGDEAGGAGRSVAVAEE